MLKLATLFMALATSAMASVDCDISESLKNKSCSSDYFTARNSKQLNEYLQYGKLKDGKLLNLEVGFDVKDKEINIGTTCDLKLKFDADLKASQNGICLQAKNIYINRESRLLADKKAPINIIANDSIKIRRTNIQTSGDVNISTKVYDPFLNEILISRDSQISAGKLNITTPSSLIINDDSRIKSPNINLNGGNCEIGESDDLENDEHRDRERQCKRFKPKFTYSGTCLNNPIPASLKISSTVDKADSLKLTYSISGAPSDSTTKWKFDDEFENSNSSAVQSFLFPGKHLAEAVISNANGYFRKLGAYNNVSPTKFNKGQVAIFQFSGLKYGPSKVLVIMGLKKLTLVKSEQNPELYSGEVPSDTAGNKLVIIPEFGYKGSFNLVVLPAISNPNEYIDLYLDKISTVIDQIGVSYEDRNYINNFISSFKAYTNSLSDQDKLILSNYLQANSINLELLMSASLKKEVKEKKYISILMSYLIPNAFATEAIEINDKNADQKQKNFSRTIPTIIYGISSITIGGLLLKEKTYKKFIGIALILNGFIAVIAGKSYVDKQLDFIYSITPKGIAGYIIEDAKSEEISTMKIQGAFVPLTSTTAYSDIYKNTRQYQYDFNKKASVFNSSVSDINNALSSLGLPANLVEINPIIFPSVPTTGKISTDYINKSEIKIIKSETGNVTISDISEIDDKISFKIHSPKTQNITIQFHYLNPDLGINEFVNTNVLVHVAPKAVINYVKTGLKVAFNSIDPSDPDITGLTYIWNFGDGVTKKISEKEINHLYNESGEYLVTLTVKNEYEQVVKTSQNIVVTQPILSSQFFVNKSGLISSFSAANYFEKYSYVWDFGDGVVAESQGPSITHQYLTPGLYGVTLTVVAPNSNQVSTSKFLIANVGQIFQYTLDGQTAHFKINSDFDLTGTNLSFKWEFSDGTSLVSKDLESTHNFPNSSNINAGLKIITSDGKILYKTMLKKSFTYSYSGRKVDFNVDMSLFPSSEILTFFWDFGDGIQQSTNSPTISHNYLDLEPRDVNLVVKNSSGNVLNDFIDSLPDRTDSSLTYQQANRNIKFSLVSNIGGVSTDFTYSWDFGDGNIVENNLNTVIHSYDKTGVFKTTVSVFDKDGKFLFSELTFILNDQMGVSFSGKPLSEITAAEYWESILPTLSSTTVSGFKYQYAFPGSGICYTNGISYFVQNGITYVYLPFYNCTEFDNIFN